MLKRRRFYAPLLIVMGGPLFRILRTGVRVLPRQDWEQRERHMYQSLHGASIGTDAGRALVLPCLPGKPLAVLLEDRGLAAAVRRRAIELAVVALAELHTRGFTHGDAMADNVLVDLEGGVANWFDFETVHDSRRPMTWRRADDVRALLATCLARTAPDEFPGHLRGVLDSYGDEEVAALLARSFTTGFRLPLPFHLGQAGLSLPSYREIARLLEGRAGEGPRKPD